MERAGWGFREANSSRLDLLEAHEEVVHGPAGFDAVLADEGGELGVVAVVCSRAWKKMVLREELAGPGAGHELDLLVPVEVGGRAVAGGGRRRGRGWRRWRRRSRRGWRRSRFGQAGEALGVAELDGDDVLEEFADGFGLMMSQGMARTSGCSVRSCCQRRGCFVPGEHFFRGETEIRSWLLLCECAVADVAAELHAFEVDCLRWSA